MAIANPFAMNPLAHGRPLKLLDVPKAPETHEPRSATRSYLAPGGAGAGGLDALLSGLGKGNRRPPVERIKVIYREAPAEPEA